MGRLDWVPSPRVARRLGQGAKKLVAPGLHATSRTGQLLWRQRFHWPVIGMGGAVLAAAIVGPAMSTPAALSSQPKTLPATAWPGLLHQKAVMSPALSSSTPSDLVPACATTAVTTARPASAEGVTTWRFETLTGHDPRIRVDLAALTLLSSPTVASVSPSSGPAAGGTSVRIDGTGLTGATAVTFGLVPALSFSVGTDGEITASSPPGVGTVDVHVVTLIGLSAASSADQFSYVAPSIPILTPPTTVPTTPPSSGTGSGSGSGSGTGSTGSGSSPGSGSGSSKSVGSGTAASPEGSLGAGLPALGPGALAPSGGVIPNSQGFTFGDGELGCGLIDNQVGSQAAGESPGQQRAVQLALSLIGTPYVWGGESTHGFDCSGLVQFVYSAAGIELPRTAQEQFNAGPGVAPGQTVVPGDLVFFGSGPQGVGHVGIFVGNGVMVDAPHTGADVRLDKINGFEPIVGVTSPGS